MLSFSGSENKAFIFFHVIHGKLYIKKKNVKYFSKSLITKKGVSMPKESKRKEEKKQLKRELANAEEEAEKKKREEVCNEKSQTASSSITSV